MRIGLDVHVLDGMHQGMVTLWHALLDELPPGHTYVLYSYDPQRTRARFAQAHFEHRRIPLPTAPLRILVALPWRAWRDGCDVLHMNYFAPPFSPVPTIITIHDLLYLDLPSGVPIARRLRTRLLGGWSARSARLIIAVSTYTRDRIVARFGAPADRIRVIPSVVPSSWHTPDETAIDSAWQQLRAQLPKRYILAVGRWEHRKNIVRSVRAVNEARMKGLTERLVVVGPDDFGSRDIHDRLRTEGIDDVVIRLVGVDTLQLQAIYRHAQALLFLSLGEGFGLPLLEAMAMSTPIIASDRTALPEVAGHAALLVDPTDDRAIANALQRVLTDDALRADLIARGRERLKQFTARASAFATVRAYEDAVRR